MEEKKRDKRGSCFPATTIMIESLEPITEIKSLETLVEHFKREYGQSFLNSLEEKKLRININLNPEQATLGWQRDFQHRDFYIIQAQKGYIVGYTFIGPVEHNRDHGIFHVSIDEKKYVTLRIELKYPL